MDASRESTISLNRPPIVLDETARDLLFCDAHTPTSFTAEPVTDEQLRQVYDLVRKAPTSMNAQPMRLVVVRSDDARSRLVAHLAQGNRPKVEGAPVMLVVAADVDFHEELPRLSPAATGAAAMFAADEGARVEFAVRNTFLQVGYLILGLRAAGLAPWPMGGFDADGLTAELFPDGRHRAVLVIALGYADPEAHRPRNPRLDYDEVVSTV